MSSGETDLEIFNRMLATSREAKTDELAKAKREAAERGKQVFDLDKLEQHYDTSIEGWVPDRAARERDCRGGS